MFPLSIFPSIDLLLGYKFLIFLAVFELSPSSLPHAKTPRSGPYTDHDGLFFFFLKNPLYILFKKNKSIYLFIFACVGSSFLRAGFL